MIGAMPFTNFLISLMFMFLKTAVPLLVFFEAAHLLAGKKEISHPYAKGIAASVAIGVLTALYSLSGAAGGSGFWILALNPAVIGGPAAIGALAGWFYKKRGRPLLAKAG